MENKSKILAALALLRRLPPSKVRQNIAAIVNLQPDIQEELLQKVDQPLELETDTKNGNSFFKAEFNRDGDSYRSPYSNEYFPTIDSGNKPSPKIRELEQKAQPLFEEYLKLYYDGGIVNTFFWDTESGFAGAILIKKECDKQKGVNKGVWDSINLIEVKHDNQNKQTKYKITSTVILEITITTEDLQHQPGEVVLSGHLSKAKEETHNLENNEADWLATIGKLVEETESNLRSHLEAVYFGKTKEIALNARYEEGWKQNEQVASKLREGIFASKKE